MNVLLLFVALHFGFLASFCQRDGSFSPLDSPSSTEWDEYVTSEVSCIEDDEWWSDSSCAYCRCKCDTRSNVTTCVSRCYDYTSTTSNYAIYEAADYCGYDCNYYRELSIDSTSGTCDCSSITYSCYNDTSSDYNTTKDGSDSRYSTTMKATDGSGGIDDGSHTENNSTEIDATENNSTEIDATEIDATEIDATEIDTTEIDATEFDATELQTTEMSDGEDDSNSDSDSDSDSIYDSDVSDEISNSYNDSSYLYIKLGLQVTRIWNSRSEVWSILGSSLRKVLSNSPDYDADTTSIYFLSWDAYKVNNGNNSSTSDDDDTGNTDDSTTTTNDEEGSNVSTTLEPADSEPSSTISDAASTGGNGGRRRILEDSTRNSEEITVEFDFSLAVYFGNSDDAQDWYDYLTSLGSTSSSSTTVDGTSETDGSDDSDESFGVSYVSDCDDEARTYDTNGWGTITLTEAYIALYDSDGNVVDETSYTTNDNNINIVPSSSSGNAANTIYASVNTSLTIVIFVVIYRVFG